MRYDFNIRTLLKENNTGMRHNYLFSQGRCLLIHPKIVNFCLKREGVRHVHNDTTDAFGYIVHNNEIAIKFPI